jgi:hypothetical protein
MRIRQLRNPNLLERIQRIAALVAAAVMLWRLREMLGINTAIDWMCS